MEYRRLYIAYGSNINLEQMANRCPNSKVIGKEILKGYELEFRGVATIVPKENAEVAMKNEQTMTEFVDRIIEIEQIAVTLPPYCYVNIDLEKEKQRAEMSDEYFTRLKKRDESNYAIAWGAFNEYSTLSSELMASVPYYEKARVRETMDVNIGVSGMIDPDDKDKTWVVDTCEFHNAQSVIQYDFFRGMQYGRAPFRCHHCGRFFLATDSYKTFYCNEKSPENPNRTCRQIGAKNKHKEKAENNPIIQTYHKARNKYYQQKFRGSISDADYDKILHYLETMRDKAIRGKSDENGNLITYKTLEQLFEKDTLYKTLNIGGEQ